jgi:pimeloyl-ACP methyl ester carboxylesterase
MSDESPWLRVANTMTMHNRVVLLRRRLYRLDLPVQVATAMSDQVSEVLTVAAAFGEPCVIVGHSSGAVVALEALTADLIPFAGAVLYEPPTPLDQLPLGKPSTVPRAREALAHGHLGRALQIFLREGVEVPAWISAIAPAMTLVPEVRRFVARQIDDLDSIVDLGVRSRAYEHIERPVWFLTGEKSPTHLRRRCQRLADLLPHADLVTLPGTGHGANQTNPRQLGDLIAGFAKPLLEIGPARS